MLDAKTDLDDPETALAYIDQKLPLVLGDIGKELDAGMTAMALSTKYGKYGTFLPAYEWHPPPLLRDKPRILAVSHVPAENRFSAGGSMERARQEATSLFAGGSISKADCKDMVQGLDPAHDMKINASHFKEDAGRPQPNVNGRPKNNSIYNAFGLGDDSSSPSSSDNYEDDQQSDVDMEYSSDKTPLTMIQIMTSHKPPNGILLSPLRNLIVDPDLNRKKLRPTIPDEQITNALAPFDYDRQYDFDMSQNIGERQKVQRLRETFRENVSKWKESTKVAPSDAQVTNKEGVERRDLKESVLKPASRSFEVGHYMARPTLGGSKTKYSSMRKDEEVIEEKPKGLKGCLSGKGLTGSSKYSVKDIGSMPKSAGKDLGSMHKSAKEGLGSMHKFAKEDLSSTHKPVKEEIGSKIAKEEIGPKIAKEEIGSKIAKEKLGSRCTSAKEERGSKPEKKDLDSMPKSTKRDLKSTEVAPCSNPCQLELLEEPKGKHNTVEKHAKHKSTKRDLKSTKVAPCSQIELLEEPNLGKHNAVNEREEQHKSEANMDKKHIVGKKLVVKEMLAGKRESLSEREKHDKQPPEANVKRLRDIKHNKAKKSKHRQKEMVSVKDTLKLAARVCEERVTTLPSLFDQDFHSRKMMRESSFSKVTDKERMEQASGEIKKIPGMGGNQPFDLGTFPPLGSVAPIAPFVVVENWVQCDKCSKWRLLPPGMKVSEDQYWHCKMLKWLLSIVDCSTPEDETTFATQALHHATVTQSTDQPPLNTTSDGRCTYKDSAKVIHCPSSHQARGL